MTRYFMVMCTALLLVATTGCVRKQEELKSPCVGAKGSPCERVPANAHWMG